MTVAGPAAAATLLVNGSGQLTGAAGVNVNGTLYDVTFVEGTCFDLFTGCDALADFTFITAADALAASEALFGHGRTVGNMSCVSEVGKEHKARSQT